MKSRMKSDFKKVLPLYLFTAFFVIIPIAYAFFLSFMTRTNTFSVEYVFTLDNYKELLKPIYLTTFWDSFKLAIVVTTINIVVGYPAGLFMAKLPERQRKFFFAALTFPFWINSIVRIASIIILLRTYTTILYSYFAVVITMVYALMPFMIYSVYSAGVKLDRSALEAARMLGASEIRAFLDITLPLTAKGLLSGVTLTFVPSMCLIYISNLLGGGKFILAGNLIENQLIKTHNTPLAAAISVVLMMLTGLVILICNRLEPVARRRRRAK
ncbi:MAG: ABC transporter permease [Oscillospiraceae bacterium]|nr:ABC transporter permease [Candidatus Limimonas coprohippi]